MMKHDILIVAPFADLPEETGNCRYFYLANQIYKQQKANVELVVSSFAHLKKEQRGAIHKETYPYPVTMIEELGYKKNVSLKRFYSHHIMGKNLKTYLDKRKKPDVILCAIPSLDAGKAVAAYCKEHHIRFVIDVQDLWPEAFEMVLHIPVVSHLLFTPWRKSADYIYRCADEIVAVSQTYADRAQRVNTNVTTNHSVFLGTNLPDFDQMVKTSSLKKPEDVFLIAYVGTLGHSYDIGDVIRAVANINEKFDNVWFVVMGDGPLMDTFQSIAKQLNAHVHFTGRLAYPEMVRVLSMCDVAVNPIAHNAAQSIINKVGDYAAAGLPVVSTQECKEYYDLIETRHIGFNCNNGDVASLKDAIMNLYEHDDIRKQMGKNNRLLAEERFDRATSYQAIINLLYQ